MQCWSFNSADSKKYYPSRILGIDIDENLIGVARKNIRHYCNDEKIIGKFPASLYVNSTVNQIPPCSSRQLNNRQFPNNVWFLPDNYVLESDEFLEMVREEYDVIMALSVTKWIHLNWGDDGLKRFFQRTFRQLRPGGRLILEVQEFISYSKRAKILPEMLKNYQEIIFKPEQFQDYLLSKEVGFEKFEELGVPQALTKGYERPILVFKKSYYREKNLNICKNDESSEQNSRESGESREQNSYQNGESSEHRSHATKIN